MYKDFFVSVKQTILILALQAKLFLPYRLQENLNQSQMTIKRRLPNIKTKVKSSMVDIADLYSDRNLCLSLFIFLMNRNSWDNEFHKFIPYCVKKKRSSFHLP